MDFSFLTNKDFYTSAAIVTGGTYFIYKLLAGWLVINLSIEIKTIRQRQNNNTDYLVVNLILEKGGIDAARLLRAELRITPDPPNPVTGPHIVAVSGTERLQCSKHTIDWNIPQQGKFLNLAPNEKTHFSERFDVGSDQVYKIEAIVIGDRYRIWRTLAQWRASAVSLPILEEAPEKH